MGRGADSVRWPSTTVSLEVCLSCLKAFFLTAISLIICHQTAGADQDDACSQFRARAKIIADPLGQPQLFATYDQNPDRLQRNAWSRETRAGVSFDLARFSEGSAIRDLAEKECDLWKKRSLLTQRTSGALNAQTIRALQKKRKVFVDATEDLEREIKAVSDQGTIEQQDQLDKFILQQKTQIALIDEQILRLSSATESELPNISPPTDPEAEISQLEQEHRDYEAERARALRLNRSNVVLSAGTIQRDTPGAVGDQLPYFFGVDVRVPISDFLLGSRSEAVTSGKNTLMMETYFDSLRLWLAGFKAEKKRLTLLSDLFRERMRGLERRLSIVRKDGGDQFAALARSLKIQMSEIEAELAYNNVMLANASAESTKDDVRIKLIATEGKLIESPDKMDLYQVKDDRLRAKSLETPASGLEMTFTYQGKTAVAKNLKSGKPRVQLGCYLAAQNQCNLLYAMWRIEPEPGIFVQTKSNLNKSTHQECGNNGYTTVKPIFKKKIGAPTVNQNYRYSCELKGSTLTVKVDNEKVWSGTVDLKNLDPKGYSGVRSDNALWQFSLTKENSNH